MATRKIQEERVQHLNDEDVRDGDYVLYWMQSAQRTEYNHALEYAVQRQPGEFRGETRRTNGDTRTRTVGGHVARAPLPMG